MRTIATSLAVVLLSASSIAIAQEGPESGGGLGVGGGPSLERGGGGGPAGGGAPEGGAGGPAGGMIERGPGGDAEAGPPGGGRAERAIEGASERAAKGRPERSERSSGPERGQSEGKSDTPSERRASKRDDGPSQKELKAGDESTTDKRARSVEDGRDKASEKAARATGKADDNKDKADTNADAARDARQSEADRGSGKDDADKRADTNRSGDKPARRVELTDDKRDNLRSAFHKEKDLKPRKQVGVDISVGRRLPRDWDYRPVPIAVVEIVPEYRDYVFVYAEDEYVICDPDTFEVVAVVPAGGGGTYAAGGPGGSDRCPARLSLSRDERELILDEVRTNDEVEVRDLEVGWSVPSNVELQRFPDAVLSKADELDGCRYFVAKDQLAIVDPIEEKVVLVIDKG